MLQQIKKLMNRPGLTRSTVGLDKVYRLTDNESYKLCVDLQDFAGNTGYSEYDLFKIASGGEKYRLSVGSYSGLISHHFGFQIFYVCH